MLEILVDENIAGQRFDRFIRKFLNEADLGFIYRMIRRGNIEINGKKANEKTILKLDDKIKFWMSDDTINKFRSTTDYSFNIHVDLDILYEDDNIIAINKPAGLLSHSSGDSTANLVDGMIKYLINKKEYDPKDNPTFSPGIANRLDRNTSGVVIGCKNYQTLRQMNESFKNRDTKRFYQTIVVGKTKDSETLVDNIVETKQNMYTTAEDGKEIITKYRRIKTNNQLSLLEVELITGRTHQIRVHMQSIGHPVLGDPKYGDRDINNKYRQKTQLLHCSEIKLSGLSGDLEYLNGRAIVSPTPKKYQEILSD